MVFYFSTSDGHIIYMGKDKYENEDLIKYGWEEDIWFHVDDFSSAHVYLRLQEEETFETIPEQLVAECCQLVKINSILGSKEDKVDIVYTPWSNLKKEKSMETGQIGYHNEKLRKIVKDVKKNRDILRVLAKTKKEEHPDLQGLKESHLCEIKKKLFTEHKEKMKLNKLEEEKRKIEKEERDYKHMDDPQKYTSNKENQESDEDFM